MKCATLGCESIETKVFLVKVGTGKASEPIDVDLPLCKVHQSQAFHSHAEVSVGMVGDEILCSDPLHLFLTPTISSALH